MDKFENHQSKVKIAEFVAFILQLGIKDFGSFNSIWAGDSHIIKEYIQIVQLQHMRILQNHVSSLIYKPWSGDRNQRSNQSSRNHPINILHTHNS